ncbi:MAG: glycosyltransferase [Bacteroidetes bacterium]|nr:glycosyltransferase [Bacteroidota bacterium]
MPRVLRILNRFNLGGPTYNAAYLTKYMAPDFETLLIGGSIDESEKNSEYIVRQLGIEPTIISEMKRSIGIKNDIIAYKKIKEIIRTFKPDIVHTHASKSGALGRFAASKMKVPIIIHTFHGHVFDSYFNQVKNNFYKTIERNLANRSTKIIAISDLQKFELSETHQICKPEKIEVIPLGFDLSRFQDNIVRKRAIFRKRYEVDDDVIAIGIIGRLVPVKNHELFLKAFAEVKSKTEKKIRAFIIGDGEEKDFLKKITAELELDFEEAENSSKKLSLTFTSWIKEADVAIAGMDIIALTSLNEGTPVSLIEAQAGNKPIVSTRVGGIENVVMENRTALLSESNDLKGFSENLLKMIENDDLRNSFSGDGWEFVKDKFHYDRLVKDMKALYNQLLMEKKIN